MREEELSFFISFFISDAFPYIIMVLFALSNGYISSLRFDDDG